MIPTCWKTTWTFYWLHKACLQCKYNTSIQTQWKSKRNQTNWPVSGKPFVNTSWLLGCLYLAVCLRGCTSVNVWESDPGILFSVNAELQRWQMQRTCWLQMCLESLAWVTRKRSAQHKAYWFLPPDERTSPKCYFSFATQGCMQPTPKKNHHVCKQMPWLTIKTTRPCALPWRF